MLSLESFVGLGRGISVVVLSVRNGITVEGYCAGNYGLDQWWDRKTDMG